MGSMHPKHQDIIYQSNYGYIPDTRAADGHEIDAYVLGVSAPMDQFEGVCIAIIHREDDNEDKLVVVHENAELSDEEIRSQTNFQEQFFNSSIIRLENCDLCKNGKKSQ